MHIIRSIVCYILLIVSYSIQAQTLKTGDWLFKLTREGGLPVYVNATIHTEKEQLTITFINDTEGIVVDNVALKKDSLIFSMPLFETSFALSILHEKALEGTMHKGTTSEVQNWHVKATWGDTARIPMAKGPASVNISGRWAMEFQRPDGTWRPAVGEWKQTGNKLTGTIINPSGDYRFLEGEVWGNQMYVTAFDGSHIYAFKANLPNDSTIEHGIFFTGKPPGDAFRGKKDPEATLPKLTPLAALKPGENRLNFRFPDIDSNMVSIMDPRFRGKVVVVQLMGSWCPNCMDETRFLSEYYNSQPSKEVEMVSLAYELSTDFHRSATSLRKFQQRFGVQYPMLITGARSSDPDKAAKTLPQLTDIKYFPTTLFIDRNGVVRKVHNGFYGPGAPDYFEAYKKTFFETLELLKNE